MTVPALDTAFFSRRALALDRAVPASAGPVVTQGQPMLDIVEPPSQLLSRVATRSSKASATNLSPPENQSSSLSSPSPASSSLSSTRLIYGMIDGLTIAVKLQINLSPPVRKNFHVERLA
jgi:hypothetical protein